MKKFAEVIIPLPLNDTYTYSIPEELIDAIKPGCSVIVNFGAKKIYTGIVEYIHEKAPEGYEIKDINSISEKEPIINQQQFDLWHWISNYYLCSLGDVYKAAVPSGLKPESETIIKINNEFENAITLNDKEQKIIETLSLKKECSIYKIEEKTGIKNAINFIKKLIDEEIILIKEEVKDRYKKKFENYIKINDKLKDPFEMKKVIDSLSRSKKQLMVLTSLIELSYFYSQQKRLVKKTELTEFTNTSSSIIKQLTDKNILEIYQIETNRIAERSAKENTPKKLSLAQSQAKISILQTFKDKNVCLLNGVTSSGKTEIYISLIGDYLLHGKQVLYLLPEIALTTQITHRLEKVFGNDLVVYHSKLNDAERVEIWKKQQSEQPYKLILGVRSSVLLPFKNLGLIIVDEEHENTFKQYDPAPRYNARDTAIILASIFKAKTLLGTATPSIESYYNAINGKYGLVNLNERYQDIKLPEIISVDIKEEKRKKMSYGQFSSILISKIKEALNHKEQVILFQNRRGFAPMLECRTCGWVPRCVRCDVSLTYHKELGQLTCHYCGYTTAVPHSCPACGDTELRKRGFGTELVENDIKSIFPEAKVARLDLDTTNSKYGYEKIIDDFTQGKTDILVGTQMVSKGLDFDNVSIVGIMNADNMLNFPDFRSYERSFQLMSQVAGRAGRKNKQGQVILQTYSPDSFVISKIIQNDFSGMFKYEIKEREAFKYPPFYRLINIYIRHKNNLIAEEVAQNFASKLRQIFGDRVLGPDRPYISRIQSLYIRKILLKIEVGSNIKYAKEQLKAVYKHLIATEQHKSFIIHFDVDPM